MRNSHKTEDYFARSIAEMQSLLKEGLHELAYGLIPLDRILSVKRFYFGMHLHLAISKYTVGMSVTTMKEDILNALCLIEEVWRSSEVYSFDDYSDILFILSLGVLLGLPKEAIHPALVIVDSMSEKDWLLEYLLSYYCQYRDLTSDLIFPKSFQGLREAISLPSHEVCERLKRYLKKERYRGQSQVYWHDNHKSKHDAYFGYWSFETVAVVKIAKIDDTCLRSSEYYPGDF